MKGPDTPIHHFITRDIEPNARGGRIRSHRGCKSKGGLTIQSSYDGRKNRTVNLREQKLITLTASGQRSGAVIYSDSQPSRWLEKKNGDFSLYHYAPVLAGWIQSGQQE